MSNPLWSMGFRPFYLGAAAFATLALPAWYAAWQGWLPTADDVPGLTWHAHEMVFGFAPAVVAGFLLTAVRNWTGLPTPSGRALAALFGLWALGRVLAVTGPLPLARLVDVAFLPVLAAVLTLPLWRSGNARNAFIGPLLLMLGALNALHHGAFAGWVHPGWSDRAVVVALDLVALLIAVIAGRVIPAFAANAIAGLKPRRWRAVEVTALGGLLAVAVLDATPAAAALPAEAWRALLLLLALVHALRLFGWRPWATRRNVLLVALPLAYGWLPVHLLVRALADPLPGSMASPALHALTVGVMAGMMLAMMTRSALGHTGRPLIAHAPEIIVFAAIHAAALARVLGPLAWPAAGAAWLGAATAAWLLAFGMYAASYAPLLLRPRVDASGAEAPGVAAPGLAARDDSTRTPQRNR